MKKLKIGQIGIGHNHGEGRMLALRKFPELFEIVGWCEKDEEWLRRRGGLACYEGLPRLTEAELLEKADAVLVECDVWNLTKTAARCVAAGRHVAMDKPANGTDAEFAALLADAKRQGLTVQMGYMYRYNPAVLQTLEHVKNGDLGEIYSINAEMSTYHAVEYKRWLTRFSGGIMYILGSHLVDLIVYLMGEPKEVHTYMKHTLLDGVDFPDNTLAVLEYDKALCRVYESSVEVNGWGRRQFVVSGSKGTADIKPLENVTAMTWADLSISTNAYEDRKLNVPVRDVPPSCRYDEMMRDFYACCTGAKKSPFSYEHDLAVHRTLNRICGIN